MEVYVMNPILWEVHVHAQTQELQHPQIKWNKCEQDGMKICFTIITFEIISFAIDPNDNNTWRFVYACAVKDSLIDMDGSQVHMDSIPLLNWFCVAQL